MKTFIVTRPSSLWRVRRNKDILYCTVDIIIKYFNLSTFELLAKIDYNVTTVCLPFTCGQTSRSTVWANGTQNSGLVNFVPESRLPFVQISSIYRKTTVKAWNRYQRWLWSNGTRISIGKFRPEKTWLPFSDVSPAIRTPFCSFLRTLASANSRLAEPQWVTYWLVSWH